MSESEVDKTPAQELAEALQAHRVQYGQPVPQGTTAKIVDKLKKLWS